MEIGVDSFAAAFTENSRAVSAPDRLGISSSRSSTPINSGWIRLALESTTAASFSIPPRPSSSARRPRARRPSGSRVR